MHAVVGALVALEVRDRTGVGSLRRVDDVRGRAQHLGRADRRVDRVRQLALPRGQPQPVGRAAGRLRDRHARAVARGLGRRPTTSGRRWSTRSGVRTGRPIPRCATHAGRRAAHDLLDEKLGAWAADDRPRQGARPAASPRVCPRRRRSTPASPRSTRSSSPAGYYEELDHPVIGVQAHPSLAVPVRRASTAGSGPRRRRSASTTTRSSPTSASPRRRSPPSRPTTTSARSPRDSETRP